MWKWAVTDATNDLVSPFTDRKTFRIRIEDEPRDVFTRHYGKLLAKQRLEIGEDHMGPWMAVVLDGYYLDNTFSQFDSRWLLGFHPWVLRSTRQNNIRLADEVTAAPNWRTKRSLCRR